MATIMNRKDRPLKVQELLDCVPNGFTLVRSADGKHLIADRRNRNQQWWAEEIPTDTMLEFIRSGFTERTLRLR